MDLSSLLLLTSVSALSGGVVYQLLGIRDSRITSLKYPLNDSKKSRPTSAPTPISFHIDSVAEKEKTVYKHIINFFDSIQQGDYHHIESFDHLVKDIISTPSVKLYIFDLGEKKNHYIFYHHSQEICQLFDENEVYTSKFSEKNQKMNTHLSKVELTKIYLGLYKSLKFIKMNKSNYLEKHANQQETVIEKEVISSPAFDSSILDSLSDVYQQIIYLDEHQEFLDTVQHHQYIRMKSHVFPLILSTYQELTEEQQEDKKETFIQSLQDIQQTFVAFQQHINRQLTYEFEKAIQLLKET